MWFKIHARHGSGHMGYTEEYMWQDERPSRGERESIWEWLVDKNNLHNARGGVTLVRELPEKVRLEKIADYKGCIERDMKMLKILGAPVLEPFVF